MEEAGHWVNGKCPLTGDVRQLRFHCSFEWQQCKKNVVNSPNGSEPKGLLKGSFAAELKSLLSVVFLESEPLPDGLKGSELKKLSVELCRRRKQVKRSLKRL